MVDARRILLVGLSSVLVLASAGALFAQQAEEPSPNTVKAREAPKAERGPAEVEAKPATEAAKAPDASDLPASKREVEPPGPFRIPDDLPESSKAVPFPNPARFVVIDLHSEVSLGMASFVERVIGRLSPGDILVLDIKTFGGRVDAAVRIRDALLDARSQHGAWTLAYVHPRAISAGALITFATDIIVVSPGATMGAATPVTIQSGEMKPTDEKVVSYMRKEMRATAEARGRNGDIAEAMVDRDREVDGLNDKGKLLTLDGTQALSWKIASFEAIDLPTLIEKLGYGPDSGRTYSVKKVNWSWAEKLAGWLSGSMLSGLLMTIGMLGIMIGLYTGGNPIPLAVGGICLALFFFGHHVVDLVGIEELLLFVLGAGLIVFELLIPGHVLPGVAGVLLIVASLIMGLVDLDTVPLSVQWEEGWISRALATVFGSILATAVLTYAAFRMLPESKYVRKLLLPTAIQGRSTDGTEEELAGLVGEVGEAVSHLRPSGKVKVAGRRYDAVAERGYVEAGQPVKVLRTRGFSIVVTALKEDVS